MSRYFITVGKNPYGATGFDNQAEAIRVAETVKKEFASSDVVVWDNNNKNDPFEIWENDNPE